MGLRRCLSGIKGFLRLRLKLSHESQWRSTSYHLSLNYRVV